jgi:hypothetical protein
MLAATCRVFRCGVSADVARDDGRDEVAEPWPQLGQLVDLPPDPFGAGGCCPSRSPCRVAAHKPTGHTKYILQLSIQ